MAHAVLLARWSWRKLPADIIGQAADFERQANVARRRDAIDQQVAIQLGSLGISPSFSGGGFLGFNPDQAMFICVMAKIREHNGDPPFGSEDVVAVAELVLMGQRQPYDALVAAAPPQVRQLFTILPQLAGLIGLQKLLLVASFVQAGFALPRERIIHLLPDAPRLQVQALYDIIQNMPLNDADRSKLCAALLWFVTDLIDKGALANFGMTKEQIVQSLPYDDVIRRLFELGWLTVEQ